MESGVVKRVIIGPEIIPGGNMSYEVGFLYLHRSIKVTKVTEDIIDGIHYTYVFVKKVSDLDGPNYLWWKISSTVKIQYNIDFNE